jgi:hypothetical protein
MPLRRRSGKISRRRGILNTAPDLREEFADNEIPLTREESQLGITRGFLFRGPTMRTAIRPVDTGFHRPFIRNTDDAGTSTGFPWLSPTRPAAKASPYGLAALAAVKSWATLAGYEILGVLNRGGMGIVYKARQLRLDRLVAVKVIDPSLAEESDLVARFRREQFLATRLTHPNLVAAYGAGQVAGLPYLVMEFVEGVGLDQLVEERGSLPVTEACEVVRQAAVGLQHMHEHGLVHRDVKPSNLMLTVSHACHSETIVIDGVGRPIVHDEAATIAGFGVVRICRRSAESANRRIRVSGDREQAYAAEQGTQAARDGDYLQQQDTQHRSDRGLTFRQSASLCLLVVARHARSGAGPEPGVAP